MDNMAIHEQSVRKISQENRRAIMDECYSLGFTMVRLNVHVKVAQLFIRAAIIMDKVLNGYSCMLRPVDVQTLRPVDKDGRLNLGMALLGAALRLRVKIGLGPWEDDMLEAADALNLALHELVKRFEVVSDSEYAEMYGEHEVNA